MDTTEKRDKAKTPVADHPGEVAPTLLESPEHVLSTLEKDGSRRWLKPKLSHGTLLMRRRIVAYVLIAIFTLVPYIKVGGKPLVLLDIPHREFTILGYTFLPTDTLLLALFMVGTLLTIFLATALVGRVWCGWACPQTVYMEFLYRPIERFFEGTAGKGGKPKQRVQGWRRVAMYATYLVVSMFLAHTFLAYFVGVDELLVWIRRSPLDHPIPFLVMLGTTGAMMFDFCFFREQLCLIACPYGRFQSVLLDRNSMIVAYDNHRGEPRGKGKKLPVIDSPNKPAARGDCVDCGLCVHTCPTGIDIRNGLQMECINCTQCIDACDAVMKKLGRDPGLIRYASQATIEGEKFSMLRPRVIIYPVILVVIASVFTIVFMSKKSFDAIILRNLGSPFTVANDGLIQNSMRVKVTNRTEQPQTFSFESPDKSAEIVVVDGGRTLEPGQQTTFGLLVRKPYEEVPSGKVPMKVVVHNDLGDEHELDFKFQFPRQRPSPTDESSGP